MTAHYLRCTVSLCRGHPLRKKIWRKYLCVAIDNRVPYINYPPIKTISLSQQLMWHTETTKKLALCMLSLHEMVNDFQLAFKIKKQATHRIILST